jgi:hypothetical protein
MKKLILLVGFLCLLILFSILYGFAFSSFSGDGRVLLNTTWGVITLIDIYIMFTLFSLWIIYREGVNLRSILLVIFMMLLGSLTATAYVVYELIKSKGNWDVFWSGKQKR